MSPITYLVIFLVIILDLFTFCHCTFFTHSFAAAEASGVLWPFKTAKWRCRRKELEDPLSSAGGI